MKKAFYIFSGIMIAISIFFTLAVMMDYIAVCNSTAVKTVVICLFYAVALFVWLVAKWMMTLLK